MRPFVESLPMLIPPIPAHSLEAFPTVEIDANATGDVRGPLRFISCSARPPRTLFSRLSTSLSLLAGADEAATADFRVSIAPEGKPEKGWVVAASDNLDGLRRDYSDLTRRLAGLPRDASYKETLKHLEKSLPWGKDPAASLVAARVPSLAAEHVLLGQAASRHLAGGSIVQGHLILTDAHVAFVPNAAKGQPLVIPLDSVADVAEATIVELGMPLPALAVEANSTLHAFTLANRRRIAQLLLELAGRLDPETSGLPVNRSSSTDRMPSGDLSMRPTGSLSFNSIMSSPTLNLSPLTSPSIARPVSPRPPTAIDSDTHLLHSPKLPATSLTLLDSALISRNFRRTFRLPHPEAPLHSFQACYWEAGTAHTGTIYISANHACFSSPDRMDPYLRLVLPLALLTSVSAPSPPARPPGASFSFSTATTPFLVLSARGKRQHWLSFNSVALRSSAERAIRDALRSIDPRLSSQKVVARKDADTRGLVERLENEGLPDSASVSGETESGLGDLSRLDISADSGEAKRRILKEVLDVDGKAERTEATKGVETVPIGLRYLFPGSKGFETPVIPSPARSDTASPLATHSAQRRAVVIQKQWISYFEKHGRDAGMLLDLTKLRELLVAGGCADAYRDSLWMLWAGAFHSPPPTPSYAQLISRLTDEEPDAAHEIEKDVRRSHPSHPGFRSRAGVDALRRLLSAYAFRNPKLGYAQAMNLIAGALLSETSEEDAYTLLCVLVERRMPEHFTTTMVGSQADSEAFPELLRMVSPRSADKIEGLGMDASLLAAPWFLSLFLSAVELSVGIRLMDVFWLEGPVGLWWVACAVFLTCEVAIEEAGDWVAIVDTVRGYLASLGEPEGEGVRVDTLIHHAYDVAEIIPSELVEAARARAKVRVLRRGREQARLGRARDLAEATGFSADEVRILLDTLEGNPTSGFRILAGRACPWTLAMPGLKPSPLESRLRGHAPDPGTTIRLLDTILKQPLNAKLRLFFELHDEDGDGVLNRAELGGLMESLLAIAARVEDEERLMRASAGFLHAALRTGASSEQANEPSAGPAGTGDFASLTRSGSGSGSTLSAAEDAIALELGEFTLAMMGQAGLTDYFGKVWKVVRGSDGGPELQ